MFFRRYRTELLIALVALIIAVCFFPIRMRFPFDDTYITFRYSANLAHGYGIVFNAPTITQPIGAHTEGYTNFLFMLILVPFVWLGWDLALVAQLINVIAVIISALALFRILANGEWLMANKASDGNENNSPLANSHSPLAAWLAAALFLLDPFMWMNAYSGLETSLFTMWLLCAVWAFTFERIELAFALSALAALTRPEGALMGMVLLAVGLFSTITNDELRIANRKKVFSFWLSAFVLPLVIYAGWKWWYFGNFSTIGALFPNSFYVKVAQVNSTIFPGRGAMRIFYTGAWYLVPLAAIAAWKYWNRSAVRIAVLWCALITGFYLFSVLIQNEYHRFMNSVEAMLILLTSVGFGVVASKFRGKLIVCFSIAILIFIFIYWSLRFRGGLGFIERTSEATSSYPELAEIFRSIPDSPSITMAWGDAGRLPYFSGMRWIDPIGLNTNEIAHARSAKEMIDYVIAQKPDLIIVPIVFRKDELPGWNDSVRMILPHGQGLIGTAYPALVRAALASTYKPIAAMPQPVYDLDLFVDTTSIHYRDIMQTITARIGKDSIFFAPIVKIQ